MFCFSYCQTASNIMVNWNMLLIQHLTVFGQADVLKGTTMRIIYGLKWRTVLGLIRMLFQCLLAKLRGKKNNIITLKWAHEHFIATPHTLNHFLHFTINVFKWWSTTWSSHIDYMSHMLNSMEDCDENPWAGTFKKIKNHRIPTIGTKTFATIRLTWARNTILIIAMALSVWSPLYSGFLKIVSLDWL